MGLWFVLSRRRCTDPRRLLPYGASHSLPCVCPSLGLTREVPRLPRGRRDPLQGDKCAAARVASCSRCRLDVAAAANLSVLRSDPVNRVRSGNAVLGQERRNFSTSLEKGGTTDLRRSSISNQRGGASTRPQGWVEAMDGRRPPRADRQATPEETVRYLDSHVIGQTRAKRIVANALRNRWRRLQLKDECLVREIHPKNILMIGPTGVGKTEIARRLSAQIEAPFIKVEATKFTEVGFHGHDVEQIVQDLVVAAIRLENLKEKERAVRLVSSTSPARNEVRDLEDVLDDLERGVYDLSHPDRRPLLRKRSREDTSEIQQQGVRPAPPSSPLLPPSFVTPPSSSSTSSSSTNPSSPISNSVSNSRMAPPPPQSPSPVGGFSNWIGDESNVGRRRSGDFSEATFLSSHPPSGPHRPSMSSSKQKEEMAQRAVRAVEQEGIVFIDEIDKICVGRSGSGTISQSGFDVSSVGVQRDLLPLIEGCTVSTPYGPVSTNHILFIASGAFHSVRPSDMLPELQGRLPVRVTLDHLNTEDLYRILTEPEHSLINQQTALFASEGVAIVFTEGAKRAIASTAESINKEVENIGARRLHSILEGLLEDMSFNAPALKGTTVTVTEDLVFSSVSDGTDQIDYRKFIL